ncbi:agmatine deiminase family protein, partial [Spiroplasma sp. hyd1]
MKDNWHDDSRPARATFAKIANAISKYEPVKMIINYEDSTEARAMLDENVILVEIKHFDSWDRDMGPLYVINKQDERRVVNFQFNGWGMQNVPEINTPDFKWDYTVDDQVSKVISE